MVSAKNFALQMHEQQSHNNKPYQNHLRAVVEVLTDCGYKDEWVDAGWLHDTLRLTPTDRAQLRCLFGIRVASLVQYATPFGVTDETRRKNLYTKIQQYPDSAIIAAAKRIAEIETFSPSSKEFLDFCSQRKEFNTHVMTRVPYAMKRRLDQGFDLRISILNLSN